MGFDRRETGQLETTGDWSLVRRSLGVESFGINLVAIAPGKEIPEHDELDRDQEEVFYAVKGNSEIVVDGQAYPLAAGTFVRVGPEHRRRVQNPGATPSEILIVSAPRSSGYEPMEWA